MKRSQFVLVAALCVAGSVLGGMFGSAVFSPRLVIGQEAPAVAEIVKAQQFVLADAKGNERARLKTDSEGAVQFELLDDKQRPRLRLQSDGRGAMLGLLGTDGKENFAVLHVERVSDEATMMFISGVKDTPVFSVQHRGERSDEKKRMEETYLSMADRAGNPRVLFGWNGDEMAQLMFADTNGEPNLHLAATEDTSLIELNAVAAGKSLLALKSGNAQLLSSAIGSAGTSLQLWHEKQVRLGAATLADGAPILKTRNAKGETTWVQEPEKK